MDLSLTGFINRSTPQVQREVESNRSFSNLPPPMLAKSGHPSMLDRTDLVAETKWDGTRVLLVKRGNEVRIFVARGNHTEYTRKYPLLVADGKKLNCRDCILDGEFVFYDARGDSFLNISALPGTIGSRKHKYIAFDILEKDGRPLQNLPLEERKTILDAVVPPKLTIIKESKQVKTNKRQFFADQLAANKEGVMLKRKGSFYTPGRSDAWLKVKRTASLDCIAKGGTEGTGARRPYFGAVHCFLPGPDGRLRRIGDVGSGFKDSDLRAMTELVRSGREFVIEVKFMEWTPDRKMRFPVFLRHRTDKTPAEVRASHD